jgi:hypothetical protein
MSKAIADLLNWRETDGDAAGGCFAGNADLSEREKGDAMRAGHKQDRVFMFPHGGRLGSPRHWS